MERAAERESFAALLGDEGKGNQQARLKPLGNLASSK
jgi:hypothetical protein